MSAGRGPLSALSLRPPEQRWPLPAGPAGLVSGDQRVQVARSKAQQNHALLERELQRRKEQVRASTVLPGVRIKEEPVSEEGEEEEEQEAEDEEPMDTSLGGGLHSRLANGLPGGRAAGGDSFNGHPPPGCAGTPVARELRAFVEATFQRQFVLTLSELKRLFNLHLASLPPGHTLFSGISDRMLQDTVLAAGCKQILVPVSRACAGPMGVRTRLPSGGLLGGQRCSWRKGGRSRHSGVACALLALGASVWRLPGNSGGPLTFL